jgi:hypothetical protein
VSSLRAGLVNYGLDAAALAAELAGWKGAPRSDQYINELLVDVRGWRKLPLIEIAAQLDAQPLAALAVLELSREADRPLPPSEAEFLRPFSDRSILRRMAYIDRAYTAEPLELPRVAIVRGSGLDLLGFLQGVLRWAQRFAHWPGADTVELARINLLSPFQWAFVAPPLDGETRLLQEALAALGVPVVMLDASRPDADPLDVRITRQLGLPVVRRRQQQQRFDFREAGGTQNSVFVVRAIGGVDGYDVRGSVGPDLGLIIDIGDREVSVAGTAYLEEHILRTINQTELSAERIDGSVRLRWYDTRLEAADLGRIIYEALKSQFILGVISVNMIFDPLRISSLKPGILSYREERENQLRKRSEDNSPFILCSSCSSYAPHTFCISTAERTPCCGRSYDELATLANLTHSLEQLAIEKGITQDRGRGRYLGTDKLANLRSEGALTTMNLHSLRHQPHLTSAIPECIAYWLDDAEVICVVGADFSGRCPDGKTFDTLLARVAGRQVPGFMGVSEAYILSPRFLIADGGLSRVGWMNSALKTRLKLRADHILTEHECSNMAALKERQAPWRR